MNEVFQNSLAITAEYGFNLHCIIAPEMKNIPQLILYKYEENYLNMEGHVCLGYIPGLRDFFVVISSLRYIYSLFKDKRTTNGCIAIIMLCYTGVIILHIFPANYVLAFYCFSTEATYTDPTVDIFFHVWGYHISFMCTTKSR